MALPGRSEWRRRQDVKAKERAQAVEGMVLIDGSSSLSLLVVLWRGIGEGLINIEGRVDRPFFGSIQSVLPERLRQ